MGKGMRAGKKPKAPGHGEYAEADAANAADAEKDG